MALVDACFGEEVDTAALVKVTALCLLGVIAAFVLPVDVWFGEDGGIAASVEDTALALLRVIAAFVVLVEFVEACFKGTFL